MSNDSKPRDAFFKKKALTKSDGNLSLGEAKGIALRAMLDADFSNRKIGSQGTKALWVEVAKAWNVPIKSSMRETDMIQTLRESIK